MQYFFLHCNGVKLINVFFIFFSIVQGFFSAGKWFYQNLGAFVKVGEGSRFSHTKLWTYVVLTPAQFFAIHSQILIVSLVSHTKVYSWTPGTNIFSIATNDENPLYVHQMLLQTQKISCNGRNNSITVLFIACAGSRAVGWTQLTPHYRLPAETDTRSVTLHKAREQ